MSNHLGNVLTVINDIKVPYLEQDNLLFKATIMRTYDYSPFGVQLDGRSAERQFCESETNEVTVTDLDNDFNDGTIQGWLRTSTPATVLSNSNNRLRIRRRPSHSTYTPTSDSWDTGIPIDAYKLVYLEEGKQYNFSATVDRNTCVGITVRVRLIDENGDDVVSPILVNPTGITYVNFSFEPGSGESGMYKLMFEGVESTILCNFHVDDVLVTHVEDVTTYFNCVGVEGYRYGYQGSEKDDEVKGSGNSYTTEFRLLDPRLGRWLSIDPEATSFPGSSPYISMNNNPVVYVDPNGDIWGIGALFEYGSQVVSNYWRGKRGYNAWVGDVDFIAVGAELIPGGGKALKLIKGATKLYADFTVTTFNEGTRVKSGEELALQYGGRYAGKQLSKKIEKLTDKKTLGILENRRVQILKNIDTQKAQLAMNHSNKRKQKIAKKLDGQEKQLVETNATIHRVENLHKAYKALAEHGTEQLVKIVGNQVAFELDIKMNTPVNEQIINTLNVVNKSSRQSFTYWSEDQHIYQSEIEITYSDGSQSCSVYNQDWTHYNFQRHEGYQIITTETLK